jgi:hypothetical protein
MQVDLVETMGHETHVGGRIGGIEARVTIRSRDFPALGSTIHLTPDPALIHLFADGRRVNLTQTGD